MKGKRKFVNQQYSVASKGKNLKEGTPGKRKVSWISGTLFSVSMLIAVSLVAFTVFFFFSPVIGTSMKSTLNANAISPQDKINFTDSVIVNRYKKPTHGDVIVVKFYRPDGENWDYNGRYDLFIKRLIAVAGDGVYFNRTSTEPTPSNPLGIKYNLEINGIAIPEPYIYGNLMLSTDFYNYFYGYQQGTRNIPAENSWDSHWRDDNGVPFFKYVPERGRTELVIPEDHVFFMGDNRGGSGTAAEEMAMSWDCSAFGPQPRVNIMGTVTELVKNKTAPQYIWSKILNFFTFKWLF